MVERIKYTTFNMSHLLRKEFKSRKKQIIREGQIFFAL